MLDKTNGISSSFFVGRGFFEKKRSNEKEKKWTRTKDSENGLQQVFICESHICERSFSFSSSAKSSQQKELNKFSLLFLSRTSSFTTEFSWSSNFLFFWPLSSACLIFHSKNFLIRHCYLNKRTTKTKITKQPILSWNLMTEGTLLTWTIIFKIGTIKIFRILMSCERLKKSIITATTTAK